MVVWRQGHARVNRHQTEGPAKGNLGRNGKERTRPTPRWARQSRRPERDEWQRDFRRPKAQIPSEGRGPPISRQSTHPERTLGVGPRTTAAEARFCPLIEVLFGRPVGAGDGSNRTNQQQPMRFTRNTGDFRAFAAQSGQPLRRVPVHGWRKAKSARRREERRRVADGGFAGNGRRAFR